MRPRKAHGAIQANGDGAFPIMSSGASRESRASSRSSYYRQYNNKEVPRPMCGQAALNKILPVKKSERGPSLLGPALDAVNRRQQYEQMPYDVTPMDNIYSEKRSKFSQSFKDPDSPEAMIYIPQFNVNKAKQVQAKKQPPKSSPKSPAARHRLSSVTEASREDTDSETSVYTTAEEEQVESPPTPPKKPHMSSKDRRIEQMIRSMQEIIMQQEENLNSLGSQNAQYRETMELFQDHVFNLKKEQMNQRNEIHKLHFERESYEAEAASLREELKNMRSELARVKSEKETSWPSSPKAAAPWVKNDESPSGNQEAPWTKNKSSPRPEAAAPWATPWEAQESPKAKETKPRNSPKDKEPSSPKRQSVSFHDQNEVLSEYVQERDDAPSDLRWERSRQRSVFSKNKRETSEPAPLLAVSTMEEAREASPKNQDASGKCSDLHELQARANELRDTVARMKLDSPSKQSDRMKYASTKSPIEASYDERKRDAVLRYSRGERGTSYWNSHDMYEGERDM